MIKWYKFCPKMRYPMITEIFVGEMLMEGNYISKEVHEEFARRIDEENTRQNRRLSVLESFNELEYFVRRAVQDGTQSLDGIYGDALVMLKGT